MYLPTTGGQAERFVGDHPASYDASNLSHTQKTRAQLATPVLSHGPPLALCLPLIVHPSGAGIWGATSVHPSGAGIWGATSVHPSGAGIWGESLLHANSIVDFQLLGLQLGLRLDLRGLLLLLLLLFSCFWNSIRKVGRQGKASWRGSHLRLHKRCNGGGSVGGRGMKRPWHPLRLHKKCNGASG